MAMDTTAECDGSGNSEEFYAWLANAGGAEATDACSDVTWTNDYATYQPADCRLWRHIRARQLDPD